MLRPIDVDFIIQWNKFDVGFQLPEDISRYTVPPVDKRGVYKGLVNKSCFDNSLMFRKGIPGTMFIGTDVGIAVGIAIATELYYYISQGHRLAYQQGVINMTDHLICHAWNIINSNVIDITLGSYCAERLIYLGWTLTNKELVQCKDGVGVSRILYKKIKY